MKLLRYGPQGQEKPGLIDGEGRLRDLSGVIRDITPAELSDEALGRLRAIDAESLPLVQGSPRVGVPIAGIRQLLGIGLNYRQHAAESNMAIPADLQAIMAAAEKAAASNDFPSAAGYLREAATLLARSP